MSPTNLTFNANSSSIILSGAVTGGIATFVGGGLTYNSVTLGAISDGLRSITGVNTFATLTVTGKNFLTLAGSQTITTLNLNGTASGQVGLISSAVGTVRTLTVTTVSAAWAAIRDMAFSGSPVANNSFDLGGNTGITFTSPNANPRLLYGNCMSGNLG